MKERNFCSDSEFPLISFDHPLSFEINQGLINVQLSNQAKFNLHQQAVPFLIRFIASSSSQPAEAKKKKKAQSLKLLPKHYHLMLFQKEQ